MKTPIFSFREIAPLLFAIFMDLIAFGLIFPELPSLLINPDTSILPIGISEHARYGFLSLWYLLYPTAMFFGAPFLSDLSDRIGRKTILLLCLSGLMLSFILMGIGVEMKSITLLFLGRGVSGLMAASMSVALAAISDLSTPDNKAVHMSYVAFIETVGVVLGPLLGGVLSDPGLVPGFSIAMPFFIATALTGIALIWIYFSFQETHAQKTASPFHLNRLIYLFFDAYRNQSIRLLGLVFFTSHIGLSVYFLSISVYLKTVFKYSTLKIGLFSAFLGLLSGIGLITVLPYVVKKYRVEGVVAFFLLISVPSEMFLSMHVSGILFWIVGAMLTITSSIAFSTLFTAFSNAADEDSQGWIMGVVGSLSALSLIFGSLCSNLIPEIGLKTIIFIGSLFVLLGSAMMRAYCKRFPVIPKTP